ncbi:MAG: type II toxin-antitoxin system RelE/ParE family toxin [Chloroflexi bacterium]|nr:type II toxin-antitoxin system RelE/ParE family toxin [Chloroflexota bacterium]
MAYTLFVMPQAWQEMKALPGTMRQRVKREVDQLRENPQPSQSKQLQMAASGVVLYRVRLDRWRLVYAVNETEQQIQVLAVRKRPPYNYDDLDELLEQLDP